MQSLQKLLVSTNLMVTAVSGFIELVTIYCEENLHTVITIHHLPHNSIKFQNQITQTVVAS